MMHTDLVDYYQTIDWMVSEHKYTKFDVDNMIPFERDILVSLIQQRISTKQKISIEAPTDF